MKQFYTVLTTLVFSTLAFAQIPSGYYDSATGTGYTLKTQLHNIIDNHNDQGYNAMDGFIASYDLDNYYEAGIFSKSSTTQSLPGVPVSVVVPFTELL